MGVRDARLEIRTTGELTRVVTFVPNMLDWDEDEPTIYILDENAYNPGLPPNTLSSREQRELRYIMVNRSRAANQEYRSLMEKANIRTLGAVWLPVGRSTTFWW